MEWVTVVTEKKKWDEQQRGVRTSRCSAAGIRKPHSSQVATDDVRRLLDGRCSDLESHTTPDFFAQLELRSQHVVAFVPRAKSADYEREARQTKMLVLGHFAAVACLHVSHVLAKDSNVDEESFAHSVGDVQIRSESALFKLEVSSDLELSNVGRDDVEDGVVTSCHLDCIVWAAGTDVVRCLADLEAAPAVGVRLSPVRRRFHRQQAKMCLQPHVVCRERKWCPDGHQFRNVFVTACRVLVECFGGATLADAVDESFRVPLSKCHVNGSNCFVDGCGDLIHANRWKRSREIHTQTKSIGCSSRP